MSLVGNLRNKPCRCGSGLKFKKCCLPKAQGFIETDSGWAKPIHTHLPDIASDCDGCYQLAKETQQKIHQQELTQEVLEIVGKGVGNENSDAK